MTRTEALNEGKKRGWENAVAFEHCGEFMVADALDWPDRWGVDDSYEAAFADADRRNKGELHT